LDPRLDLGAGIGSVEQDEIETNGIFKPKKWKRRQNLDADEAIVVDSASSDEPSDRGSENEDAVEAALGLNNHKPDSSVPDPLLQHLSLLSESQPCAFCEQIGPKKWTVPFKALIITLLQNLLVSLISIRFGAPSARLIRILLNYQPNTPTLKLAEEKITQVSLLPQKKVRAALSTLQAAHFLALQEIPRDNQRQASRTTFLWFFDAERVRILVEGECYKTMARLIQRLNMEKKSKEALLEKCDRADVRGNEHQFLTTSEAQALKEWRAVEAKVWGQIGRLDDMVMVLRDF
jgi:DNA-directed RNA polymerase III subunit RPC3